MPLEAEVTPWNGVEYAKTRDTKLESGERRLLGKNFLPVQRIQIAASAKQAGGANRRGGDEAAAKDGYYERSDK